MPSSPDLSPYGWSEWNEALCVAVVTGRTEDEVLDAYGGDPAATFPATFEGVWDLGADGDVVLLVRTVGDRVLAVENNGYEGSRPEVLREVTAPGAAMVSVFWNVSADRVSVAGDGALLVAFEGLFPEQRQGTAPDSLLPLLRDLGYRTDAEPDYVDHAWKARALALLDALTGVRVTEDVLAGPWRAARLHPLPEDLPPRGGGSQHFVRHQDPEVAAALDAAAGDAALLRRAAVAAARATVAVADAADEPLLADALARAAAGRTGAVDRRSPLGRLLGAYVAGGRRAGMRSALSRGDAAVNLRDMWRLRAGNAVRAALAPDPLVAAWEAASEGGVYLPQGAPVRAALLAALRSGQRR
jgi:Family of unknown function (DUF6461)